MSELVRGFIGKEDIKFWDGVSNSFTRKTITGGSESLTRFDSDGIDVLHAYGSGSSYTGDTIQSALSTIGSTNNVKLRLTRGTWIVSSNLTIGSNIFLQIDPGAVLTDDANNADLTINGAIIAADTQQIFDWGNGSGSIAFGQAKILRADWFGKTAAGLQQAYDYATSGSTIMMSGGTWAFGTSRVTMITNNKVVNLKGVGYAVEDYGTKITYSGAADAIKINGLSNISDILIDCGGSGAYGLTLGNSDNEDGQVVAWQGKADNIYVTGATIAGIRAYGIQLGILINCFSNSNTGGAGLIAEQSSGANTNCQFHKCRFRLNTNGILFSSGETNFKFYGCDIDTNTEEAVKGSATVVNTLFESCWFENNGTSYTGAGTYYQINLSSNSNDDVVFRNNTFEKPANEHDGTDGVKQLFFSGKFLLENNRWQDSLDNSVPGNNKIDFGNSANAWLLVRDRAIDFADLDFGNASNRYYNLKGFDDIISITSSQTLPAILFNCIINNVGASGTITVTLPPVKQGQRITFQQVAEYTIDINPDNSDSIRPITTGNGKLIRDLTQKLGDQIVLSNGDGSNWLVESTIGEWVCPDTNGEDYYGKMAVEYDVSIHGGGVGEITFGYLPVNSSVTKASYRVVTAMTSGGAAEVKFGIATNHAGGLVPNAAYNNAQYSAGYHDATPDGTAATFTNITTSNRAIIATIITADLTDGKIIFFLDYIQSNSS